MHEVEFTTVKPRLLSHNLLADIFPIEQEIDNKVGSIPR